MCRTEIQERFFRLVAHWEPYHRLANLPDEICEPLIELAICLRYCGYPAIQARAKLDKLASMTDEEIRSAFEAWLTA